MDRPERKVLWLPAAEIRPNPMQPRRTFEEIPNHPCTVRNRGIPQNAKLRKNPKTKHTSR